MSARLSQSGGAATVLPREGMSRWQQLSHFVPVSRETWRKLGLAGRAPAAIRLSERCSLYSNVEVHRWLADPIGYRQEGSAV
ncbi:transcriptional regulator [Duganella callida]|uniref:Transcriptional regulator n=1 Tax=Duganella callida TaxID=2561932 RepID=A0A4Y9S032_9BURK|nr:transcriptional regulator [Duganella callida]